MTSAAAPAPGTDESPGSTNSGNALARKLIPAPPPLPPDRPPVDFFRELLAMTPEQRRVALTNRPPESQKLINAKIQEYEALPADQRELRLRLTELRYYLLPLLSAPADTRERLLERVPSELRPLVEQRLRRWDELPLEKQKELLDNETWLRYAAEAKSSTPLQQQQSLTNMPPAQRQALETAVHKWKALNEDRRLELTKQFEEYFGLSAQERARTLRALSEQERRQMERTLQSFGKLDPAKRARCVSALDKLAQLTPEERQEFLANAERWQALNPAERKAWRDLVFNLSLPPKPRIPPPPLPTPPRAARPSATVATNR